MYTKRSNIKFVLVIILMVLMGPGSYLGCEPEDVNWQTDCGECFGSVPDSAKLIVYVTIDARYDSVPLTFYKGDFEEGAIDWQDTATTEEFFLDSEMDRTYTVRATYRSGNETIYAFDSDKMYIYDAAEECGSPCYIVKGGILDLRLAN